MKWLSKKKIAKGETRKAVVYLNNSEQQLKDVMQENHDLQLEVDLYKSQVKVKDNYAKRVLKENNELREQIKIYVKSLFRYLFLIWW